MFCFLHRNLVNTYACRDIYISTCKKTRYYLKKSDVDEFGKSVFFLPMTTKLIPLHAAFKNVWWKAWQAVRNSESYKYL